MRVKWIRHITRPANLRCTDATRWLVLEESVSFYIVYESGTGYALKRKLDYEVVT